MLGGRPTEQSHRVVDLKVYVNLSIGFQERRFEVFLKTKRQGTGLVDASAKCLWRCHVVESCVEQGMNQHSPSGRIIEHKSGHKLQDRVKRQEANPMPDP